MAPAQGWHAKSWSVPHFLSALHRSFILQNNFCNFPNTFCKICNFLQWYLNSTTRAAGRGFEFRRHPVLFSAFKIAYSAICRVPIRAAKRFNLQKFSCFENNKNCYHFFRPHYLRANFISSEVFIFLVGSLYKFYLAIYFAGFYYMLARIAGT